MRENFERAEGGNEEKGLEEEGCVARGLGD